MWIKQIMSPDRQELENSGSNGLQQHETQTIPLPCPGSLGRGLESFTLWRCESPIINLTRHLSGRVRMHPVAGGESCQSQSLGSVRTGATVPTPKDESSSRSRLWLVCRSRSGTGRQLTSSKITVPASMVRRVTFWDTRRWRPLREILAGADELASALEPGIQVGLEAAASSLTTRASANSPDLQSALKLDRFGSQRSGFHDYKPHMTSLSRCSGGRLHGLHKTRPSHAAETSGLHRPIRDLPRIKKGPCFLSSKSRKSPNSEMSHAKTAYELRESQVRTPPSAIALFWDLLRQKRNRFDRVLDLGAGDGRFAVGGTYGRYVGVEIDRQAAQTLRMPRNARICPNCAFLHKPTGYDACIGNPPYVRHHNIESPWKEKTIQRINQDLGIKLDRHGNLYLYFLALGLIKSCNSGIVALIIPFEWVSRPSAAAIRDYIHSRKWNVSIYRFQQPIFQGVLTTASISLIDKQGTSEEWQYYDVLPDLSVQRRNGVSGSAQGILRHEPRGKIWGRRGMSPGAQKIFTLTEGGRIHAGLKKTDVVPCVTTLRCLPRQLKQLSRAAFAKHLVEAGRRCWLIRSNGSRINSRVKAYLGTIPAADRQTYTCLNQDPWYAFETAPIPDLLFHSGFTEFGPKVLINSIGAQSVGSVYGIHCGQRVSLRTLQSYLVNFNFEKRVVAHAKSLKKVEVQQLNSVLADWLKANE